MTTTPTTPPTALLTPEEEITLRRVAFGESPVRTLPPQDLARLRALRLIMNGKDGPELTTSGRQHFQSLPKVVHEKQRRAY